MSERNPIEDLESFDDALGELEDLRTDKDGSHGSSESEDSQYNGVETDEETLREAAEVFDALLETSGEMTVDEVDGDEDDFEQSQQQLRDYRDSILTVADGEGSEDTVEDAIEGIETIAQLFAMELLQAQMAFEQ